MNAENIKGWLKRQKDQIITSVIAGLIIIFFSYIFSLPSKVFTLIDYNGTQQLKTNSVIPQNQTENIVTETNSDVWKLINKIQSKETSLDKDRFIDDIIGEENGGFGYIDDIGIEKEYYYSILIRKSDLKNTNLLDYILCYPDKGNWQKARINDVGSRVKFKGKIEKGGVSGFHLEDCTFVF